MGNILPHLFIKSGGSFHILSDFLYRRIYGWRVKTTRIAGGLTWSYKGLLLAAPQGAAFSSFKPGAPIT
jgi:hypothetical protein